MRNVKKILGMGISIDDPYVTNKIRRIRAAQIHKLHATQCKIEVFFYFLFLNGFGQVEKGANAFGCADEYEVLQEGEVFFQFSSREGVQALPDGTRVAVTRNPCHFPSDVQIFTIKR